MVRVPILDLETATGETARFFEFTAQLRGRVPNSGRVWGHVPYMAKFQLPAGVGLQREGAGGVLSCRIKEMGILKTSHINTCNYWLAHNTALGQASGITEEQVLGIGSDEYLLSPHFSPRERAAVGWAEHIAKNTARERDDVVAEVKRRFSDAELVELTGACALFALSNRFQDSMRLPIEEQHEVDKIKASVRADPARIKTYLEQLVAYWPAQFPVPTEDAGRKVETGGAAGTSDGRDAPLKADGKRGAIVPLTDPKTATGDVALYLKAAKNLLDGVPNAVRAWAHIPHVAKLVLPFQVVLERAGAGSVLPGRIRTMARLKTNFANEAPYSLAHGIALGRAFGLSEAQIAAIGTDAGTSSPVFTPRERAALQWAACVAHNTAKHRDDVFEELKTHYNDAEIVELTGLCALANMMDRFHNALRIPLETPAEIEALNRSPWIDPAAIRTYLQTILASWPQELPVPVAA